MTLQPPFLDEEKSLACVHCGLCLGACPTYLETGNENESPRGRIYLMRALQAGRLPLDAASVSHIDRCLGCRACEVACPSGVQYGTLLEQTRDHVESRLRRSPYQSFLRRVVIEKIFPVPWKMKWAVVPARAAKAVGLNRFLPGPLREALDLLPRRMVPDTSPEISRAVQQPARGTVGFIRGCVMSVMFGDTNASSIALLNRAGFDVVTPREQVCCGALFAHSGRLELAREHAARNIAVFANFQLDAIVINAAGCGSTLKEYSHLVHQDPAAKQFSAKVRDLTEFLADSDFLKQRFRPSHRRVTYHDACHLAHAQRITTTPRALVRAVAGAQFVELAEADVCCGSAGTYNLTEPELSRQLQARKTGHILETGAEIVVTSNPGCIMQIRAGLDRAGRRNVQVMHIADFLNESLMD